MSAANPMRGVIPYLTLAGRGEEACAFYARAFAAEDLGRMPMPDGVPGLMHAQLLINGGCLMLTDHAMMNEPGGAGPGATRVGHLQLVVAEGRPWWDRAVAAGCTVLAPYERQFWGDDWGLLEDPFGIRWAILEEGQPAGRPG